MLALARRHWYNAFVKTFRIAERSGQPVIEHESGHVRIVANIMSDECVLVMQRRRRDEEIERGGGLADIEKRGSHFAEGFGDWHRQIGNRYIVQEIGDAGCPFGGCIGTCAPREKFTGRDHRNM